VLLGLKMETKLTVETSWVVLIFQTMEKFTKKKEEIRLCW